MKLYEVNERIMRALSVLEEEGGEVNEITMKALQELDDLQMEKDRILEYLAKVVLNTRSEAAAIKAEEERLKNRRKALETKEERVMAILDRECNGEKTDLGVATVSYRKSESIDVSNRIEAIKWLHEHDHEECIKVPEPEVMKDAVKKLIKTEIEIPGVTLVIKNNCSLK